MTLLAAPTSSDHARRAEELGRIIMAYSEVTERLQRSHDQLTETVRRLQDELGEKNRLLERSNRLAALGEMAAGMAHEIRNPLGGIQLYASVLEKDLAAAGRDDCVQVVRKISGGVKRLEGLVGQVLSFTREMRAQCCPIDLAEVVAQAADDAADAMRRRRVRCVVDGPRPMPVRADPLLLGQALLNLVLNATQAIDESGQGGTVTLIYMPPPPGSAAQQFHLVVRDDGPGIPPDVMDRIFNPFFTTRDEGTGLGLAMVHRVVEAHDGTITAANTEGGGARFEIRV
jgi:signal transduction histidine kinase